MAERTEVWRGEGIGRSQLSERTWAVALALFAAALLCRWMASLRIAAIFNDGPHFILMAQRMAEGRWLEALSHPYHPLYPVTIWIASLLTAPFADPNDPIALWESAAVAASIVAGSAAVVALFFFLRSSFGAGRAWIGAAIMVVHPNAVAFSSDVQSEGLYIACFLAALALLWRAWAEGSCGFALAAGMASGLAYATRPEGIGVVLVGAGLAAASLWRGRWHFSRALPWLVALAAGLLVAAAPYLLTLHSLKGEWVLSQKKSIANLVASEAYVPPALTMAETVAKGRRQVAPEVEPPPARSGVQRSLPIGEKLAPIPVQRVASAGEIGESPAATGPLLRVVSAVYELTLTAVSGLRIEVMCCVLLGAYALRWRPGPRALFIALALLVYGSVLMGLLLNVGYLSRRHVLPPLLPLLGYAAVGVPILGEMLLRGLRKVLGRPLLVSRREAVAVGLALLIALGLSRGMRLHREDRLAERHAAEWLGEQTALRGPVAAEGARVAYYAGERLIQLRRGGQASMLVAARAGGARFVIVDEAKFDAYPGLREGLDRDLRLIHRAVAGEHSAVVLEVVAADPSS